MTVKLPPGSPPLNEGDDESEAVISDSYHASLDKPASDRGNLGKIARELKKKQG